MPILHVLDTHTLLWFLEGSSRLGVNARRILLDHRSRLVLPAIALAEACWIIDRGRTNLASTDVLLSTLDADPRFEVAPLDRAVVECSRELVEINEIHDRQIVATALLLQRAGHHAVLLTIDRNILKSGRIPVDW